MTRPLDIIFIVLDTQRADRLSCYGCPAPTSPNIDALAAESTFFSHAFSAAQWTIPSHASMFTGVYPSVHGTVQSYSVLPNTLPTLAERLREGGYFTTAFCNNPLVGVVNNGLRRGFYSFLNYSGLFTSRPNQAGVHSGWIGRYRQWFKNLVVNALSRLQDAFARSQFLLALSFTPLMVPVWQTALSFKGNTAKSLNDAAKLLVERRGIGDDQPICSFINLMGTHMPYRPPRRFVEHFAPLVLHDTSARRYLSQFNTDIYGWYAPLSGEVDAERKAILDGMYNAEVACQDELVGAFLQKLRESGRLDKTLLVVCADHGDHLGEKQLVGHIFSTYNELVHVPLMIRDPIGNLTRGTQIDSFVSTRRLFHTVLDAAGLASDTERRYSLAQNKASDPDDGMVFAEAVPSQQVTDMLLRRQPTLARAHSCDQARYAVCSNDHKLIQIGADHLELYNICDDPNEHVNLRDIMPEKVETLHGHLEQFVNGERAAASAHKRHHTTIAGGFDDPTVRRRLRDLGYLE